MTKEYLEQQYKLLCELYGVKSSGWDMTHVDLGSAQPSMFCPANRRAFIAEYLEWEAFTKEAKKHNVCYYVRIDDFLEQWHKYVYRCLCNLE
jgi:hypothetical protein